MTYYSILYYTWALNQILLFSPPNCYRIAGNLASIYHGCYIQSFRPMGISLQQHHLSPANALGLSRMSNIRHIEIINSIIKVASHHKKLFANGYFKSFDICPQIQPFQSPLSKTFKHLNTGTTRPDVKRQRTPAWVDLENALFEWQQCIEKNKATVTGDLLNEMASVLWEKLPQYEWQPKPKFSTGWLEGFQDTS